MQFRILHGPKNAPRVIQLAIVEVGKGRELLGLVGLGTRLERVVPGEVQFVGQPGKLTDEEDHVLIRIQQAIPRFGYISFTGIGR